MDKSTSEELRKANEKLVLQNQKSVIQTAELLIANRELKQAEEMLRKVNNLYAFISEVNKNIVRVKDKKELFNNACRIAHDYGKFKIAWIGIFDEEKKKLKLVSQIGVPEKYIDYINNAELDEGGINKYVLRTGTYHLSNDVLQSAEMENWRPIAVQEGIQSTMVLPIRESGEIVATLNLYSEHLNYFDNEVIEILEKIVDDISFALDLFVKVEKFAETEDLLEKSEMKFRSLIENSTDVMLLTTVEGKPIYGSPAITRYLGYTMEDAGQILVFDVVHPDELEEYKEKRKQIIAAPGKSIFMQHRLRHKNGGWLWCEGLITNMLEVPGVNAMVSNFKDISERKMIEENWNVNNNNLTVLVNNTNDLIWSVDRNYNLITSNEAFDRIVKRISGNVIEPGTDVFGSGFPLEQMKRHKAYYDRAFSGEKFTVIEHNESPVELWMENSYYPIREGDEVIGASCHSRDITEWEKANIQIKQNEKRMEEAQAIVHLGHWEYDLKTNVSTWSEEACRIYGVSLEDSKISRVDWESLLHPDDYDYVMEKVEESEKTLSGIMMDHRIVLKDGTVKYIYSKSNYEFDSNGKPVGIYGIIHDVTEEKKREELLEFNKNNLRALINNTPDMMWSVDRDYKLIISNTIFDEDIKNKSGKEIKRGMNVLEYLPEEKVKRFQNYYKVVFSGETFTVIEYDDSPEESWAEISFHPIRRGDEIIGAACHASDITEWEKREKRIKQSEKRLTEAQAIAHVGNWDLNFETGKSKWSEEACRIYGIPEGENIQSYDEWISFVHPDDLDNMMSIIKESEKTLSDASMNYRIIRKDGSIKHIFTSFKYEFDHNNKVIGLYGITHDITGQKMREEVIEQSEKRLKEAQAIAHIGNWELNFETNISLWSDESCRIFGIPVENNTITFEVGLSFIHPDDLNYVLNSIEESKKTLAPLDLNYRIVRRDGKIRHIHVRFKYEYDGNNKPIGLNGTIQDITEQKVQEELQKKQTELERKNRDLENFAFMASHDLQEPLRTVISYLKVIDKNYGETLDEKGRKYIDTVNKAAGRMGLLISSLLDYSLLGENKKLVVADCKKVIDVVITDLDSIIKSANAKIEIGEMPKLGLYEPEMRQLLQNLIINGIKYSKKDVAPEIKISSERLEGKWKFTVSDNGIGIEANRLSKVFDLFYRSQNSVESQGYGIGLANCKKIVLMHQGEIWMESEVGAGSKVIFTIPDSLASELN